MRLSLAPWKRPGAGVLLLALLATRPGLGESRPEPSRMLAAGGWREGLAVPIATSRGKAAFDVPTEGPEARTLIVVSVLDQEPGPFEVRLTATATGRVGPTALADDGPRKPPRLLGAIAESIPPPRPLPMPPDRRTFHIMVREGDPASARNYLPVAALLRAVGQRVQIYVDERDVATVGTDVLADLTTTFDTKVFPLAARLCGPARDIDQDGRFTILISGWLARMGGGRLAVDGCARGADFDPRLSEPFGNHCDMLYLSGSLKAGPYLRTVLAHEYTHAASFSQKMARARQLGLALVEEEGWIDEALAHLVEDRHSFSRSNLDYRVSAFLSSPQSYRLIVADYYAEGLFRSHGHRGSTYLFHRWCAKRFGPELLGTLLQAEGSGVEKLEQATGCSFADLFRRWSVDLYMSQFRPGAASDPAPGAWPLAGPRASRLTPGGEPDRWSAAGTSCHFTVIEGSPKGAVHVEVAGPPGARLQVTAVPLPRDLPRLELSVHPVHEEHDPAEVRILIHELAGRPLTISSLSWEPIEPVSDPLESGFHHGGLDEQGIERWLHGSALEAGGQIATRPIPLEGVEAGDGPLVFKLVGSDRRGRRVAAWATVDLSPDSTPTGAGGATSSLASP